ncbi:MAG: TIR domain-containing protein [Nitrosomonas sp.]|nr:MAG: TIR domain-containing protein [Nitrosomonas sp.]
MLKMAKIFISYRRDDSADYAGRLYDRLAGHFGRDHVFMDIDQIEPGEVFDNVIKEKLATVQAAVVLIGKRWLDIADANGQRRLDHPDDWVQLEITALLERDIRVIPVLVGGAAMPQSTQLPEYLAALTRRQALEITSHARFHADADKLIKVLEKIMNAPTPTPPPPPPIRSDPPEITGKPNSQRFMVILGAITVLLAALGLFHYSPWIVQENGTQLSQPIASEPEESVVRQSTAEQAAETSSIPVTQPIEEQPGKTELSSTEQAVTEQPKKVKTSKQKYVLEQPIVSEQPAEKIYFVEPEMVRILPGKFMMGSSDDPFEKPIHEVTIVRSFEIGKYEIMFDEYDAFANATKRELPYDRNWGRGKRPEIKESFNDAQAYVHRLSQQTGKKYRLPTEAEWEYAARAGSQAAYWWGNDIGQNNANCSDCGSQWDNQTALVGSFKPNAFGLYDTAGNVWEWVEDCWHDNYHNAPNDGFAWKIWDGGDCYRRVVRGGSWRGGPQNLRSAFRNGISTFIHDKDLGFRIVRDF